MVENLSDEECQIINEYWNSKKNQVSEKSFAPYPYK